MVTSESVKPISPNGDSFERGPDPWHEDAFPDEFRYAGSKGTRKSGWFVIDWAGNAIGFIPDGTPVECGAPGKASA